MKVSVVIPLYNKTRHIGRAINSVLSQTYQNFELIVVDDGSTDGGGNVVRQFTDPRIRLLVQKNAGVSVARNRGIQEAACDLVAFLDADDEWMPSFLETVLELQTRHPEAGMYATSYSYAYGDTTRRPSFTACNTSSEDGLLDDYFRSSMGTPPVWASAVMIPKRILAEVGNFPVGIKRGEDLNTWSAIALRYRVAWSSVEGAIQHCDSDNRACNADCENTDLAGSSEIEEFLQSGEEPVSSRHMVEEYLVFWRLRLALRWHLLGNKDLASILLAKTRDTKNVQKKKVHSEMYF